MGRFLVALLLLVAFSLGTAVSYYNWDAVTFNYLAGRVQLPLIALLLAAFVLGIVVMWLLNFARVFMLGRDVRRQQRQIREMEAELKNLRNLPLEPGTSPVPPAKAAAATPGPATRNA